VKRSVRTEDLFYTLLCHTSADTFGQEIRCCRSRRNKNEREGQAMEKLERAVPVVMGLVVSISLIATAWDISFVSTLP
jgi:hypothetical protein